LTIDTIKHIDTDTDTIFRIELSGYERREKMPKRLESKPWTRLEVWMI
jgi:hypothetical protein